MRKHAIKIDAPSLTQQHSKDECDINNIMKRYIKTGVIDHVSQYQPQYTENTATDYHESMNIVANANSMFADLPAKARKHFNNDPAQFLTFVEDESNHPKLYDLGLSPTPLETPAPATPADPQSNSSPVQPGETQSEPAPAAPTLAE